MRQSKKICASYSCCRFSVQYLKKIYQLKEAIMYSRLDDDIFFENEQFFHKPVKQLKLSFEIIFTVSTLACVRAGAGFSSKVLFVVVFVGF